TDCGKYPIGIICHVVIIVQDNSSRSCLGTVAIQAFIVLKNRSDMLRIASVQGVASRRILWQIFFIVTCTRKQEESHGDNKKYRFQHISNLWDTVQFGFVKDIYEAYQLSDLFSLLIAAQKARKDQFNKVYCID